MIRRPVLVMAALGALAAATASQASPTDSVIFLTKNTNSNQVHYAVQVDAQCRPEGRKPVYAYWRMLEKGPNVTESLRIWEQPGYGVRQPEHIERTDNAGEFEFFIRGVPDQPITLRTFTGANGCEALATTLIDGQQAIFQRIDIEVSGWANVHRVEIFGAQVETGAPLREIKFEE